MASRTSTSDLQDLRVIEFAYIPRGTASIGGATDSQAAANSDLGNKPFRYNVCMVRRLPALIPRELIGPNAVRLSSIEDVFSEPVFCLARGQDAGLVPAHFTVSGLRAVSGNNLFFRGSKCVQFVSCNAEVVRKRTAFPETLDVAHAGHAVLCDAELPVFGGNQQAGGDTSVSSLYCSVSVTDKRRSSPVDGANSYEWPTIHGMSRLARFNCTRRMRETRPAPLSPCCGPRLSMLFGLFLVFWFDLFLVLFD